MRDQWGETQFRVERDLFDVGLGDLKMWLIVGPYHILSGSAFFKRENAKDYAEQITGQSWKDLTGMGYKCCRVTMDVK